MKLEIPAGAFRAYLFDCDGTIADSMPLHYIAWKKALAEWNCDYDEKLFYSWGGKPVRKIIADLNELHGLRMPVDPLAARKEALYHEQLPQLKAIPPVLEHVLAQHGRIPLAVVSGSRRDSVVGSLTALASSTNSTPSSARKTTPTASQRPTASFSPPHASVWNPQPAWSSKTRHSA
jgi:beta-phosphoglucomutase-like phosphatase (HAD superfamily)